MKKRFIQWIEQTLREIKEARLGYYNFLIKKAKNVELKMTYLERKLHGF